MFCTKCGHKNVDGAAFCTNCGNNLQAANYQHQAPPPQGQYAPPQYAPPQGYGQPMHPGYPPQMKKSKKGLVIGLIICGVVLIAAAIILIIIFAGGSPVVGEWRSEDRDETITFNADGTIRIETQFADETGRYTYDSSEQEGVITILDEDYDFEIRDDEMYIEGIGYYSKTQNRPNAPAANSGIVGKWYGIEGYVGTIEFFNNGSFEMEAMGILFSGNYSFDTASGKGEIDYGGMTSDIELEDGILNIEGSEYTREYVEQEDLSDMLEYD